MRSITSLFTAAVVALTVASSALAQQGVDVYGGEGGNVQEGVSGEGGVLGQLPFTGLELTVLVGVGLALVILGLSLRRVSANRA